MSNGKFFNPNSELLVKSRTHIDTIISLVRAAQPDSAEELRELRITERTLLKLKESLQ